MGSALRIGVVGCSEGTHGKVWAELLASPAGARFGMAPVVVWDRDHSAARSLATALGCRAVAAPEEAGQGVDGVMITELMPDRYLELARPFLRRGMRVFLNRPFAGSVADAHELLRLAHLHGARIYSASALFHTQAAARARESIAKVAPLRLFTVTGASDHIGFYLPHAIATMVSALGAGVRTVRTVSLRTNAADPQHALDPVVVYVEFGSDAAIGPARGTLQMIGPGASWYGFTLNAFGAAGEAPPTHFEVTYDLLLEQMAHFFRTGEEPVPREVILEKTCVFHAAIESARRRGAAIDVRRLVADRETR